MGAFADIVRTMAEMDIFQLFFPWLFILAVTYGILDKYEIFSEDAQVNGIISLSIAFMTIVGSLLFVPAGMFAHFAAALTFAIFALVGVMILIGVTGTDIGDLADDRSDTVFWGALIIGAIILIAVVGTYLNIEQIVGFTGDSAGNLIDDLVMPIVTLLFLFLIVGAVAQGGGGEE